MKKWDDFFKEDTSPELDEKVFNSVQAQLRKNKSEANIFISFWRTLFSKTSYWAYASLAVIITGTSLFLLNNNQKTNMNMGVVSFTEDYEELVETPEDVELLANGELELIENLDLLEKIPEDV